MSLQVSDDHLERILQALSGVPGKMPIRQPATLATYTSTPRPTGRARILALVRRLFIGVVDEDIVQRVNAQLIAIKDDRVINHVNNMLDDADRKSGDGIELGTALDLIEEAFRLHGPGAVTPPVPRVPSPPESTTTSTPIPQPVSPGGIPAMASPTAPATPVAPPEMDLTVPRDKWAWIINQTSGHLLAYGPPGTGKSHDFMEYAQAFTITKNEAIFQAASEKDTPETAAMLPVTYEEVNCTRQTSAASWVGHWIDRPGGFEWNDGPVARAMKAGVPIVMNDIHLCSDDLFDLLFFVLDTRPGAKLSLPNGTHLTAQPGFRALMSMNGDPRQVLDEPITDRMAAKYEIAVPSEAALKRLDKDVRGMCRHLYAQAKGGDPKFTYRTFASFCLLRRELGDQFMAARLACETEQRARAFIEPLLVKG